MAFRAEVLNSLEQERAKGPYKFSLTRFIQEGNYSKEQFLNCEATRLEAKQLIQRVFREQVVLRRLLDEGLELCFDPLQLQCFDPINQFDHAVFTLRLNHLGPSRFRSQTNFYRGEKLVAITSHDGQLKDIEKA